MISMVDVLGKGILQIDYKSCTVNSRMRCT